MREEGNGGAVLNMFGRHIRLKVTFYNSVYLELMREEGNGGAVLISAVFGTR